MKIKQRLFPFLVKNSVLWLRKKSLVRRFSLMVSDDTFQIFEGKDTTDYPLDKISLMITEGLLYSRIKINSPDIQLATTIRLLSKDDVSDFFELFEKNKNIHIQKLRYEEEKERQRKAMLSALLKNEGVVSDTYQYCVSQFKADTYLTSKQQGRIRGKLDEISALLNAYPTFTELNERYIKQLDFLKRLKTNLNECFKRKNREFEENRQTYNNDYFESLESNPLTDEQRNACTVDDNWNLVLASAGSGKTSVIVGKAGLLMKNNEATDNEILILSFANDASKEINQRIQERLIHNKKEHFDWARDSQLEASTFHSLGCKIIRESRKELNKKPPAIFAKSESESQSDIKNQLVEMLSNDQEYAVLIHYLASYQKPNKTILEFESTTDFTQYIESSNLTTLNGEDVKSYEEYIIANYLYLHDVHYTYEKKYPGDILVVGWAREYHPDFTIQEEDKTIYLEHYGVDRDMNPPEFFTDPVAYKQGIVDKQKIHDENNTILTKTFSYEMKEGNLEKSLRDQLEKEGIIFSEKPTQAIIDKLTMHTALKDLSELLYKFLNQFKASQIEIEKLESIMLSRLSDKRRASAFYRLFKAVYERYQEFLDRRHKIDFNDMINEATEHLNSRVYKSQYTRILVDEFQDISKPRMNLVRALVENGPDNSRVFCVGDDFQAIYAFTGCDIAYIKFFKEYFDVNAQFRPLFKTFRFNNKIGEVANHFIEKNTFQKRKPVITHQPLVVHPTISLVKTTEDVLLPISYSMQEIIKDSGLSENSEKKVSVLVLTRFNKTKKKENERLIEQTKARYTQLYPNLTIKVMTYHKSKGQGEDYVIMLDLTKKAFPCEKVNDPLLDILTRGDDTHGVEDYPNAEERRLFYVGLTRAKKRVYMVVHPKNVSKFIIELLRDQCDIEQLEDKTQYNEEKPLPRFSICTEYCSGCSSGILEQQGATFLCSRRPACTAEYPACTVCGEGVVLLNKDTGLHTCSSCEKTFDACNRCDGWYVERKNNKDGSKFMTCAYYFKNGCQSKPHHKYKVKKRKRHKRSVHYN